jgi:hypothetical protein
MKRWPPSRETHRCNTSPLTNKVQTLDSSPSESLPAESSNRNTQSASPGGEGWIARTNDGGKSWKTQLQHKYIVNQLFALNDQQAWATLERRMAGKRG